jgi:hypothetical protein
VACSASPPGTSAVIDLAPTRSHVELYCICCWFFAVVGRRNVSFVLQIVRIVSFSCPHVQVCDVMAIKGSVYAIPVSTFLLEER